MGAAAGGPAAAGGLSEAGLDAIGFAGGGVLAICLVPQVAKIVLTRSAKDISILWSLLYITGLGLTMGYLVLKNAIAAWIPLVFEVAGCLVIIALKVFFECTAAGRRMSLAAAAAAAQRDALAAAGSVGAGGGGGGALQPACSLDASVHSLPGISHVTAVHAEGSWHGGREGSWHGGREGIKHRLHGNACDGGDGGGGGGSHHTLEIKCGGSSDSASGTTDGAPAEAAAPRACAQQQQQQQQQPLFPNGWREMQPVPALPPHPGATGRGGGGWGP